MSSRYKRPAWSFNHSQDYVEDLAETERELQTETDHLFAEQGYVRPYKRGSTTQWNFCEDCKAGYWQPVGLNLKTGWYIAEPKCRKCWSRAQ